MPIRRGHIAPQNTFIDTLIQKFDGQNRKFLIANAVLSNTPVIFCNNGFCNLVGYSRAVIMQNSANLEFLHGPLTSPQAIKSIYTALHDQEETEISIILYKKNGMRLACNIIVAPVRNEGGEVRLYILTFQSDMENNRQHSYHNSIEEKKQGFSFMSQIQNILEWIVLPWKKRESSQEQFDSDIRRDTFLKSLPVLNDGLGQASLTNKFSDFIEPQYSDLMGQHKKLFENNPTDNCLSTAGNDGDQFRTNSFQSNEAEPGQPAFKFGKPLKSNTDVEIDSSKEEDWLKLPNQNCKKRLSMTTKHDSFNQGLVVNTDVQVSIHSNVADKFTQMLSFGPEINPERKMQSPRMHRCTLKHYGLVKAVWDWLILILVIYTAISTPYVAAFLLTDDEKEKRNVNVIVQFLNFTL